MAPAGRPLKVRYANVAKRALALTRDKKHLSTSDSLATIAARLVNDKTIADCDKPIIFSCYCREEEWDRHLLNSIADTDILTHKYFVDDPAPQQPVSITIEAPSPKPHKHKKTKTKTSVSGFYRYLIQVGRHKRKHVVPDAFTRSFLPDSLKTLDMIRKKTFSKCIKNLAYPIPITTLC